MKISDLPKVAVLFVVAGIALGVGAQILGKVQTGTTENSTAYYAVENATTGISQISQWMPTIGLVVAAAIVIGIVFAAFTYFRAR